MAHKQILIWTGGNDDALCAAIAAIEGAACVAAINKVDAIARMQDADAFVTSAEIWDQDFAHSLDKSARLSWVQIVNAGFDNIESLGVPRHITLSTSGPVLSTIVAEHALALLLAMVRGVPMAMAAKNRNAWDYPALSAEVVSLRGAIVTVLGFGAVGRALAPLLTTLGARVKPVAKRAREGVEPYDRLASVLEGADALVITAPLTKITRHMIDEPILKAMKQGAFLVNVSRGPIVDTNALVDALENGGVAGAALDVTDPEPLPPGHPLWSHPNTIITPHIASAGGGVRIQEQMTVLIVANVRRFVLGEKVQHVAPIEYK